MSIVHAKHHSSGNLRVEEGRLLRHHLPGAGHSKNVVGTQCVQVERDRARIRRELCGSALGALRKTDRAPSNRLLIEAEDAIDSFCEELEWRAVPEDERVTLLARHRRR